MSFDLPCGEGRPDGSTCAAVPTRLYPRGNRCPACAPLWQPEPERRRALTQIGASS